MLFFVVNNSSDSYSFVSNTITISANSSLQVTYSQLFNLSGDANFLSEIRLRNLTLTDGQHTYTDSELISILPIVASSRVLDSNGNSIMDSNPLPTSNTKRMSEVRSRAFINKNIQNTLGLIYTVTAGKTFYLTQIGVSALNTSSTNPQLTINDNGSVKLPFLWQNMPALGQPQPFSFSAYFGDNPISFSTNITATQVAGTISASIYIVGYEE